MATRVRSSDEDTVRLRLDKSDLNTTTIGLAIADAISALKDVEPDELDPLYYSIDTEAIGRLIQHTNSGDGSGIEITFTYDDCEVIIDTETVIDITVTTR